MVSLRACASWIHAHYITGIVLRATESNNFLEGKSIVAISVLLTSTGSLGSEIVNGLCPTKRANKSPCRGRQEILLSGGSSGDGVLKGAGSSQVCDMTCAREGDCFKKDNKTLQQCDLEPLWSPWATREKMFACVTRSRCGVLSIVPKNHGSVYVHTKSADGT